MALLCTVRNLWIKNRWLGPTCLQVCACPPVCVCWARTRRDAPPSSVSSPSLILMVSVYLSIILTVCLHLDGSCGLLLRLRCNHLNDTVSVYRSMMFTVRVYLQHHIARADCSEGQDGPLDNMHCNRMSVALCGSRGLALCTAVPRGCSAVTSSGP
jgi:hypothetical protein